MRKICIIMPTMGGGGAEKMIRYISNSLSEDTQKKIYLILFKKQGNNLEKLNKNIEIVDLNANLTIKGLFTLLLKLKRIKPDILFLSLGPLNAVFSPFLFLFKDVKVVARETNVPSIINELQAEKKKIYKLINILYKTTYRFYDRIICQSNDMKRDLVDNYGINERKLIVINNLIDVEMIEKCQLEKDDTVEKLYSKDTIYGLAMGRLTKQKGYDLLIKNMKKFKKNVVIYILGEGELKEYLINEIKSRGLEEQIKILPFSKNPFKYLKKSDFFIFPSRVEGFPNALIEALGCGVPAIVNNCPGGINEIIKDGFNGKIVNFEENIDLEKNILEVINYNRDLIKKDAVSRFDKDKILYKYMTLFEEL